MSRVQPNAASRTHASTRRIGCVSYLNAKPLIDGLDTRPGNDVRFDVPSRLLADLQSGDVDVALCPVIDFFASSTPLEIVPSGGIGCNGPTLTVRIFSRTPIADITAVHADTDSHTSVALMRVLLAERYGLKPAVIDYDAREHVAGNRLADRPAAMLLIGDKVITSAPSASEYPFSIDLGGEWRALTGLPFVFAVWMCREGAALGDTAAELTQARVANASRIDAIVKRYASAHGWPEDVAKTYLGRLLRFEVGPREIDAIERFGALATKVGAIPQARALKIRST